MARVLEELDEPGHRPVEALVHHYAEAGETANPIACLLEAGDRAEAVYDHDDALRRYREAAALVRGDDGVASGSLAEIHERIGDVHRAIGQIDAAFGAYSEALALLDASEGASAGGAELHRKIALTAMLAPDMTAAGAHLALAQEATGSEALEEARNLILQVLIDWHMNMLSLLSSYTTSDRAAWKCSRRFSSSSAWT